MTEEDVKLVDELTIRTGISVLCGRANPIRDLVDRLREQDKRIEDLEQKLAAARVMLIAAGARRRAG